MTKTEELTYIEFNPQLCPWKLSRQIVNLGGRNNSYFKWVHPYCSTYVENLRKYVFVEWYQVANRKTYPAYLLSELLWDLPNGYMAGSLSDEWYCKDSMDSWDGVEYYGSAVEACAHCYIEILKKEKPKQ